VKFTTSFVSQIVSGILSRRFGYAMALALLCASASPGQVAFLGAQSTVPATGLSGPFGAAMDSSGNLYIADTGHNQIVKIDPAGNKTTVSVSPLSLSLPSGVAVDGSGNLYVSDSSHGRVVKVPAGGGAATAFATVTTPRGLAVDASGNVFVADEEDAKIVKITSGGVASNFEIGLSDPVAVAVDAAGNVYLADDGLSHIEEYPPSGEDGTDVGSLLVDINGVAVDRVGNVYVAESGEGTAIVEITRLGVQTTLATSGLGTADYLTVDSNYDLFIPDDTNNDVVEFATQSVNMGYANVCKGGAPTPCSRTATLNFALGDDSIAGVSVVTTGDTGLDFSTSGGTCSGETSPCTVTVVMAPTAPGMRSGAVIITDTDLSEGFPFPVYGTGIGANASFTPALTSPPIGSDGFGDPFALAVAGNGVYGGGPIFIADDEACVIWVISGDQENFSLFAGNYTCGYSGDGGAATSAELNSPEDVALDGAGNLYIADFGNSLVRKVDVNGTITRVAGSVEGGAGFSGDGGPATAAQLDQPDGVALDKAGNLYIADSGNNRIRKVDLAGIITTVAGSNQAGYSGDGGQATSAKLNFPLGVRADSAGNLFIADSNNNVIRKVDLTGTITTVAGNFELGAGYTGDGGAATSAQLSFPNYVSVDAAGELFIADDNNGVIRRVDGGGTITTYPVPTDFPSDLVVDAAGNLAVIDPEDEAMTLIARTIPGEIDFGSENVNTSSKPQDATVTNIGNQALDFSAITPPTGFNLGGPDTSCSTDAPLGIGIDCILGIVFDPPTAGGYETAVALTDNSLGPAAASMQNVPVTGTGVVPLTPTTTVLTASPNPAFAGQTVTLTATVSPVPTGDTLGSVDFCLGGSGPGVVAHTRRTQLRSLRQWTADASVTPDASSCGAGTLLGTGSVGANGVATFTITSLALGANSITAVYGGNPTLNFSTSDAVTVTINAPATTTTTVTISPNPGFDGQSVTLTGTVSPVPTGSSLGTITFCDSGAEGPKVRRSNALAGPRSRRVFASSVSRPLGAGPCGVDASLGMATVSSQGTATLALTTLETGDHNIYAVYSGNTGFGGSASEPVDETVDAAYTVTAPQTPFDVPEGGSVEITVTVPPLGGTFDGVVTLVATGLPRGATATFNPPTVTPGAEGEQTMMTIQLAPVNAQGLPPTTGAPVWPVAGIGSLLLALTFVRRRLPRLAMALVFVSLISAATLTLAGCNGGFPGLSTPKGQYVVTVTGTSGSLHPSTTVTVVVQ